MSNITIRIPQQIQIEYTLKSARLVKRILDLLNALIFRDDSFAEQQADNGHPANPSSSQLRLGDLALQCFGPDAGVELDPDELPSLYENILASTRQKSCS